MSLLMLSFCSKVKRPVQLQGNEHTSKESIDSSFISSPILVLNQESQSQMRSSLSASRAPGHNPNALCSNQHLAKPASRKAPNLTTNFLMLFPNVSTHNRSKPRLSMKMPPSPPNDEDLNVGDVVDVPGKMYGTVRFIGQVNKKSGVFAGVELSEEFACRGKNSGDVDGVSYFSTTIAGSGIFLPVSRATRRKVSPKLHHGSLPPTPTTPIANGSRPQKFGMSTQKPPAATINKFNQSVGNQRFKNPQTGKMSRPSLSRPESPVRASQLSSRPSLGPSTSKTPIKYGSPAPKRFGQSVRGTQDSRDTNRRIGASPHKEMKAGLGARSTSALGYLNFSEDEATPTAKSRVDNLHSKKNSVASSYSDRTRPNSRPNSGAATRVTVRNDENQQLRAQLEERDRRLQDQASSLAEMENALAEVQSIMESDSTRNKNRGSIDDKDVYQLRAILHEKNEKIAILTAEFDAHRADFRSTIDTLELASTETERVYEQRINDLLQENRELAERTEDVDSVAIQLKQLEELVQELEDGLEDARRGEAEARGEVEFLRGEVERTRSELKREREKAAIASNNNSTGDVISLLEQRDNEIRGLKAIIHSLSRDSVSEINGDHTRRPIQARHLISDSFDSIEARLDLENPEQKLQDPHSNNVFKGKPNEDLERELENLRRGSATSVGVATQESSTVRNSKGTTISWRDRDSRSSIEPPRRTKIFEKPLEGDAYSSASESFCELCETPGHDILVCTNMFNTSSKSAEQGIKLVTHSYEDFKPAPLSPTKNSVPTPVRKFPNPTEIGPIAGKESGVINLDKWCGVCEREGHDSIDCPYEDAF
ncbi:hypothetical protein K3495_g8299 [Podosphaera aphanis]|nr:hypothetical protein K3495_g8299 [Podosphaera aphanis]